MGKTAILLSLFMLGHLLLGCSTGRAFDQDWQGSARIKLNDRERAAVLATALRQHGVPYRHGGTSPRDGLDCSGLVYYAYQSVNVPIPRSSYEQAKYFRGTKQLQKGDLVFFKINGREVSHVGIYLGNNEMLHAPGRGRKIKVTRLDLPYWQQRIYKYARI